MNAEKNKCTIFIEPFKRVKITIIITIIIFTQEFFIPEIYIYLVTYRSIVFVYFPIIVSNRFKLHHFHRLDSTEGTIKLNYIGYEVNFKTF